MKPRSREIIIIGILTVSLLVLWISVGSRGSRSEDLKSSGLDREQSAVEDNNTLDNNTLDNNTLDNNTLDNNTLDNNTLVSPGDELFERLAQRYEEAKDPTKAHTFKYILWERVGTGYGNILSDYASGIAWALATDRLIYVELPHKLDHLITTKIPQWQDWPAQKSILEQTEEGQKCLGSVRTYDRDMRTYTSWLVDDHRNMSQCLWRYGVYGDYAAPALLLNPHYKEFFQNYTTNYNLFNFVANQMWKPAPAVQVEIDNVYANISEFKYKIGLHIRKYKWKAFANNFPYRVFCDLANSLAVTSGYRSEEVVIFAGADNPRESFPILEKCLYPHRMVHSPIAEGKTVGGNPGTDFSAIVDLFLLSKCDDVISTIGSSFSEVAAGFGGITPWHVLGGDYSSTTNPPYYKQINSEPCMYKSRTWRKQEGEKMELFTMNGLYRQFESCHPDAPDGSLRKK